MQRISLLETAHDLVGACLQGGDAVIDATVGNGHDTAFLAEAVGAGGHVYGFDIQAKALHSTRQRLQQFGLAARVTLFEASHADMLRLIPEPLHGRIKAVMFNLGYLPGADKSLITQTGSTLRAMDAARHLLAAPGIVTVLAYPGHAGGDEETRCLTAWLGQLDSRRFSVETLYSHHHQESAPRLFVIKQTA
ncbi:methyltransferase domain-containing protein [Methylomonas sp. SURF-2]|uniref:Methyltransferase domain-containing protein n=1 Tax=Methylomonas subterranea TaxID=2952225 RepID=A0ABT1TLN6_9GAMM|nr:class I SAM-dependent methyltransferase [Methylomonas sp. SURF-2]MCQ8106391.1 methyltransferase domain-containing protein [Methylomonas sp. SURF-2]